MTSQTRSVNKGRFEQGDTPQGSDYADLIDSYLSLADTTAQSLSYPLSITGAISVSTTVSANSMEATTLTVSSAATIGLVCAETAFVSALEVSQGKINTANISAANATVNTLFITNEINWRGGIGMSALSSGVSLPASAAGFLSFVVSGQTVAVPYY